MVICLTPKPDDNQHYIPQLLQRGFRANIDKGGEYPLSQLLLSFSEDCSQGKIVDIKKNFTSNHTYGGVYLPGFDADKLVVTKEENYPGFTALIKKVQEKEFPDTLDPRLVSMLLTHYIKRNINIRHAIHKKVETFKQRVLKWAPSYLKANEDRLLKNFRIGTLSRALAQWEPGKDLIQDDIVFKKFKSTCVINMFMLRNKNKKKKKDFKEDFRLFMLNKLKEGTALSYKNEDFIKFGHIQGLLDAPSLETAKLPELIEASFDFMLHIGYTGLILPDNAICGISNKGVPIQNISAESLPDLSLILLPLSTHCLLAAASKDKSKLNKIPALYEREYCVNTWLSSVAKNSFVSSSRESSRYVKNIGCGALFADGAEKFTRREELLLIEDIIAGVSDIGSNRIGQESKSLASAINTWTYLANSKIQSQKMSELASEKLKLVITIISPDSNRMETASNVAQLKVPKQSVVNIAAIFSGGNTPLEFTASIMNTGTEAYRACRKNKTVKLLEDISLTEIAEKTSNGLVAKFTRVAEWKGNHLVYITVRYSAESEHHRACVISVV